MRSLLAVFLLAPALLASGEFSNRRAPGFSLQDSNAVQYDPQDFRGKVVIVEFMQTTCPHCAKFSEVLEEAKAKYKDKIQILSVVTMPDTLQQVRAYAAAHKVTGPILFDSGQVMASYLKITPQNPSVSFPHTFLIDGKGIIRNDYGYNGSTASFFEQPAGLFADIDKLLAGK